VTTTESSKWRQRRGARCVKKAQRSLCLPTDSEKQELSFDSESPPSEMELETTASETRQRRLAEVQAFTETLPTLEDVAGAWEERRGKDAGITLIRKHSVDADAAVTWYPWPYVQVSRRTDADRRFMRRPKIRRNGLAAASVRPMALWTWLELQRHEMKQRLKRLTGYASQRVGEASHPGPAIGEGSSGEIAGSSSSARRTQVRCTRCGKLDHEDAHCPHFQNPRRQDHPDASFGDTVPHMRQVKVRRDGEVWEVEDRSFTVGRASGQGNNCLIDTLRQAMCHTVSIVVDPSWVRRQLQSRHPTEPHAVTPNNFLELEHHWRDVLILLGEGNKLGRPLQLEPSKFRVVCVDLELEGHGDVVGEGTRTLYIAREHGNHFVPLRVHRGRGQPFAQTGGPGRGGSSSSGIQKDPDRDGSPADGDGERQRPAAHPAQEPDAGKEKGGDADEAGQKANRDEEERKPGKSQSNPTVLGKAAREAERKEAQASATAEVSPGLTGDSLAAGGPAPEGNALPSKRRRVVVEDCRKSQQPRPEDSVGDGAQIAIRQGRERRII
jgi:hypothetical protein